MILVSITIIYNHEKHWKHNIVLLFYKYIDIVLIISIFPFFIIISFFLDFDWQYVFYINFYYTVY